MSSLTQLTNSAVKQKETKRDRFLRLATNRLNNALEDIRLIENVLQNRNAYEYNFKDVEAITEKLTDAIKRLDHYWRAPKQAHQTTIN